MKLFVHKNDTIDIKVFCYENNGSTDATFEKSSVPDAVETQEIVFKFRKPTYKDSYLIMHRSQFKAVDEEAQFDASILQDQMFRTLIVGWDITNEKGQVVEINSANIDNLVPSVVRAGAIGLMSKINL